MIKYTPRQMDLLRAVRDHGTRHGYAPSLREMAEILGISTTSIFEHLRVLEKKGAIKRVKHSARCIEIVDQQWSVELALRDRIAELERQVTKLQIRLGAKL